MGIPFRKIEDGTGSRHLVKAANFNGRRCGSTAPPMHGFGSFLKATTKQSRSRLSLKRTGVTLQ